MMLKYVFREPLVLPNRKEADPQVIGEALAKISAKCAGELTPQAVVEAAASPKHKLHPFFEWDDSKAAAAHRLNQARVVIRSIRVEDEAATEGSKPAFLNIAAQGGHSYRTVADVERSADLQRRVLVAAERDLLAWERRYQDLGDVCVKVRDARELLARKIESRVSA